MIKRLSVRVPDLVATPESRADWHGQPVPIQSMLRLIPILPRFVSFNSVLGKLRVRQIKLMQSLGVTSGKALATIVLAEDEADLRALYADCLRRTGYIVWEAADGAEAIRLVRAHTPDLLLLDIWMPVFNGLEVLEQIGRAPEAIGVRVVVLSHVNDADTRLEGFALGVDDYWTKDITLEQLCAGIRQMVSLAVTEPGDSD